MKIIIAILIFSLIIIFHELGHFLLAKANGIRVNEFCLGLGPKVFGITKGETTYSLHLFPIGGACMMEGEDTESEDGRAFGKKSVWARISVVIAGPVFNFLMAFVFAFILKQFNGADTFWKGFRDSYLIWLIIDWYDALILDCLWFCHSKKVRIPGTENMEEYKDYRFHIRQSCIGMALGLPACLAVGALTAIF